MYSNIISIIHIKPHSLNYKKIKNLKVNCPPQKKALKTTNNKNKIVLTRNFYINACLRHLFIKIWKLQCGHVVRPLRIALENN